MAVTGRLPENIPRRGLTRKQAAEYVGVSITTFDMLVKAGQLPKPLPLDHGHMLFDRKALDLALDRLSGLTDDIMVDATALDRAMNLD